MPLPSASGTADNTSHSAIRVMLVDDSAVIRGALTRLLQADNRIAVVSRVKTARLLFARPSGISRTLLSWTSRCR